MPKPKGDDFNPLIGGGLAIPLADGKTRNVTDEVEAILKSLKIDPNDLDEEASNHSSTLARVSVLSEEASSEARWAKRTLEIVKAEVDHDLRREQGDGKKPTEAEFKAMVEVHKRVVDASEDLLDTERVAGILKAITSSVKDRKDMIAEMSRNKRHEWVASGD